MPRIIRSQAQVLSLHCRPAGRSTRRKEEHGVPHGGAGVPVLVLQRWAAQALGHRERDVVVIDLHVDEAVGPVARVLRPVLHAPQAPAPKHHHRGPDARQGSAVPHTPRYTHPCAPGFGPLHGLGVQLPEVGVVHGQEAPVLHQTHAPKHQQAPVRQQVQRVPVPRLWSQPPDPWLDPSEGVGVKHPEVPQAGLL
eukprot:CAMPEP_0113935260 /NCGR_PEP_ID=MMETSP1339-20121228/2432_1 /TAXON_ID=94617 /ORGANISM="Fibrocapsa japonica" /LENGTH=194 /DNA_ID=CAMNT_0000937335 /DNA_START=188 /DNA_END=769 /DNA_ORIENTATION=- /assembly_acc=CAM_ASM_000762